LPADSRSSNGPAEEHTFRPAKKHPSGEGTTIRRSASPEDRAPRYSSDVPCGGTGGQSGPTDFTTEHCCCESGFASERRWPQLHLDRGELLMNQLSPADPSMPPPASFVVGANIKSWRGGGHLGIWPGAVILEPGPLLSKATSVSRIVHTTSTVIFVRARLAPPWLNTSIILIGDDESAVASTWGLARGRLRRALGAAGFVIEEVPTWFSLGKRLINRGGGNSQPE